MLIYNQLQEFGAVSAIFESDEQTSSFVNRRLQKKHKEKAVFYKSDEDANYAERHQVDLSKVESFIAKYPSPDNVFPVSEVKGTKLDGCFIGACTTAEEDLIIGAMVLEVALKSKKVKPVMNGRRLVVPGSRPISKKLELLGYMDFYKQAGFKVAVPGCSMCVGQGIDQAKPGEVWLSSQNRNFHNRMGIGE
jgi:homoaconitase/3-isopropylmalate dehydratase large subunit